MKMDGISDCCCCFLHLGYNEISKNMVFYANKFLNRQTNCSQMEILSGRKKGNTQKEHVAGCGLKGSLSAIEIYVFEIFRYTKLCGTHIIMYVPDLPHPKLKPDNACAVTSYTTTFVYMKFFFSPSYTLMMQ